MNKKIAIIGARGQLGSGLLKLLTGEGGCEIFPLFHEDIEITEEKSIKQCLDKIDPDIVINTAAYVRVDDAESNQEKSFFVNAVANQLLALYCKEKNKKLVYISTDYVFGLNSQKNTPYIEIDTPGPVNTYGITKLAGEYYIQYLCTNYLIIRSSGVFGINGSSGKGGNFIETMLQLTREGKTIHVVNDQVTCPTYSVDLAKQIVLLLEHDTNGIYHAVSEDSCSWYTFAESIFSLTGINADLKPVSSKIHITPAKRPYYSALGNTRLTKENINIMRSWKEGLKDYLKEKALI